MAGAPALIQLRSLPSSGPHEIRTEKRCPRGLRMRCYASRDKVSHMQLTVLGFHCRACKAEKCGCRYVRARFACSVASLPACTSLRFRSLKLPCAAFIYRTGPSSFASMCGLTKERKHYAGVAAKSSWRTVFGQSCIRLQHAHSKPRSLRVSEL